MAADKAVTVAIWAKAKRLYCDLNVDLRAIAELVGLAPIQLSLEAKARGWPPRKRIKRRAAVSTDRAPKAGRGAKPIVLVQRVYNTIDGIDQT